MTERITDEPFTDEEIRDLAEWASQYGCVHLPDDKQRARKLMNVKRAMFQLLEEREWQPISEAPKDGTIVDLLHPDFSRITDCWWDDDDELWAGLPEEVAAGVTHFMRAPYTYPPQDGEA